MSAQTAGMFEKPQEPVEVKIEPSWKKVLQDEFKEEYFRTLTEFVKSEYQHAIVCPPPKYSFRSFELTPFEKF